MLLVHDDSIRMYKQYYYVRNYSFTVNYFIIEDNFGGRMKVNINWDAAYWYGDWAVNSVKVVYP